MGCYNSTVVNATVDDVWSKIKNFHDLSWAKNVITNLEVVGEKGGDQLGSKRVLNGAFHETLLAIDEELQTFKYSIDDGPDAVSKENVNGYIGEVKVFAITDENKTLVVWSSHWDSSNGGVEDLCNPIYQALLGELKSSF